MANLLVFSIFRNREDDIGEYFFLFIGAILGDHVKKNPQNINLYY
jgi:hypothetical protein